LDHEAIAWFHALGEGRYLPHAPMLIGSGYLVPSPVSITTPATGPRRFVPLARPPGK
jgi:hypothetical protein